MPKPHKPKTLPSPAQTGKIQSVRERQKRPNTQTPAEKLQWKQIRAEMADKRRSARAEIKAVPSAVITYSASGDGLKRGPKVDQTRAAEDKCTRIMSTAVTPNEWAVFEKCRTSFPFPPTPSQFLRWMAVTFMARSGGQAFSPQAAEGLWKDPEVQVLIGVVESRGS